MERLISCVGLFAMVGCAWLLSEHKTKVSVRVVVGGLLLQFALGLIVLRTDPGQMLFHQLGAAFNSLMDCVDEGSKTVFGISQFIEIGDTVTLTTERTSESTPVSGFEDHFVAFKVLPTIIFFSSLMAVLYHLRIMQKVVAGMTSIDEVLRLTRGDVIG